MRELSKLDRLFRTRPAALGASKRYLLCRECAGERGLSEELTIGLPGLLACEGCGAVGQQAPGWTNQIGAYARPGEEAHATAHVAQPAG